MDNTETLDWNNQEMPTLRASIRRFLQTDTIRSLIDKWEPTGVFFEKYQLTWRDCFFLSALTENYHLLGSTLPPHSKEEFSIVKLSVTLDPALREPTADDDHKFAQAMAAMREDGPGHCKFSPY